MKKFTCSKFRPEPVWRPYLKDAQLLPWKGATSLFFQMDDEGVRVFTVDPAKLEWQRDGLGWPLDVQWGGEAVFPSGRTAVYTAIIPIVEIPSKKSLAGVVDEDRFLVTLAWNTHRGNFLNTVLSLATDEHAPERLQRACTWALNWPTSLHFDIHAKNYFYDAGIQYLDPFIHLGVMELLEI